MNVPNHEKKAFRDMTPEERGAIVEAWLSDNIEYYSHDIDGWQEKGNSGLYSSTAYRTRPRQLVIPWGHIKPEYKWAALGRNGKIIFFTVKPSGFEFDGWNTAHSFDATDYLNINTTGIDWRESLTPRPEGV